MYGSANALEDSQMQRFVLTMPDNLTQLQVHRWRPVFAWFVFLLSIVAAATSLAQGDTNEKEGPPEPRPIKLETIDKVRLRAAYFPSDNGKSAIPILIVHEWKGQASPYFELCKKLQASGHAVLVPEYRGHGGSRDYVDPKGQTKQFDVARMSKRDIERIIAMDLESTKGFLKEENNEGKLNLNALVVIGIGEGAVFAAQWSQRDWKFPSVGRKKQGQDVKGLIYISPEKQIKGIGIDSTLDDKDLIQLPTMIIAGKQSKHAEEAIRIAKQVEGTKKRIGRGAATGFNFLMPDTSQSGARLVNDIPAVSEAIVEFISKEVKISDSENEWVDRL